jgi:hypothetical protein
MKRRPMTKRRAPTADERTTAYHEAGHACVAIALHIAFRSVDIISDASARGRIHYVVRKGSAVQKIWNQLQNGQHEDPAVIDYVERRIVTHFAGAIAQRRYAPNSYWNEDASSDLNSSDVYLQRLFAGPIDFTDTSRMQSRDDYYDDETGDFYGDSMVPPTDDTAFWYPPERITDAETLKAHHANFDARTKALVRELWPEIKAVAGALLKEKVLSQAEVLRLMTEARPRLDLRPRPSCARYFQANDRRAAMRELPKKGSRDEQE